ncbi:hypothetical protein ZWY2020_032437 [Hordeum vulgare]|nr:hypothetical protein ZWY2020_032437 [Hordeum vulgare]
MHGALQQERCAALWGLHVSPYPFVSLMRYGRFKRKMVVEDLNKRWKHLILNTTPTTPIEPCEWLNKLLIEVWPNYMEPKLLKKFQSIVERRLKNRKPKLIVSSP